MKTLWNTLVLLLALNFLAVTGDIAWLFQSGHLDKQRIQTIKETVFPPPPTDVPATQPGAAESAPPASARLAELLAKHAIGRSAAEQVEFIQQTFDVTMAQLDRREREVADREKQVARANSKLADDRGALDAERQKLTAQERDADRLAGDKGFQDTLNLYNSMPSRQVKGVFMTMEETSAAEYLDAMQPRNAARIFKEFKTPQEIEQMKKILDKMRHPPGAPVPATQQVKE